MQWTALPLNKQEKAEPGSESWHHRRTISHLPYACKERKFALHRAHGSELSELQSLQRTRGTRTSQGNSMVKPATCSLRILSQGVPWITTV